MDISNISNDLKFNDLVNKIKTESDVDFEAVLKSAKESQDEEQLKKVCQDFEAIFVNMILKNMRSTVESGGLTKKSHAREMFESMLDEEMSNNISKGQGVGIADMLYRSLQNKGNSIDFKG